METSLLDRAAKAQATPRQFSGGTVRFLLGFVLVCLVVLVLMGTRRCFEQPLTNRPEQTEQLMSLRKASLALAVTLHGTRHKGLNDVAVYSLDLDTNHEVIDGTKDRLGLFGTHEKEQLGIKMLRGMEIVQSRVHPPSMFVLDALRAKSKILKYDNVCALQEDSALSVFAESDIMVHPYGIARSEDAIWVTCQDTGSIIRFPLDNAFNPEKITTLQQPRATVFNPETRHIYIAERLGNRTDGSAPFMGHIVVFDAQTRHLVGKYDVPGPIGMAMFHGVEGNELMVGSEMTNKVYALDPVTMREKRSFSHAHLKHPAGIAVHGNSMFVISQKSVPNRVFEFDLVSGEAKIVLDNLPGLPECLAVLPCIPQKSRLWPQ